MPGWAERRRRSAAGSSRRSATCSTTPSARERDGHRAARCGRTSAVELHVTDEGARLPRRVRRSRVRALQQRRRGARWRGQRARTGDRRCRRPRARRSRRAGEQCAAQTSGSGYRPRPTRLAVSSCSHLLRRSVSGVQVGRDNARRVRRAQEARLRLKRRVAVASALGFAALFGLAAQHAVGLGQRRAVAPSGPSGARRAGEGPILRRAGRRLSRSPTRRAAAEPRRRQPPESPPSVARRRSRRPVSPDLAPPPGMVGIRFRAMGTDVLVLAPRGRATRALVVESLFAEWERALSRFRPESDLSLLNAEARRAGAAGSCSRTDRSGARCGPRDVRSLRSTA